LHVSKKAEHNHGTEAILSPLEDSDLADRLRENGLKTAKEFTQDKILDKIETLFNQALAKSRIED
jgi:hypothetical protein